MNSLLRVAFVATLVAFASTASAQDALKAPHVYPNPVASGATLSVVADAEGASVEVLDILGRSVDARALAAGTYLARVSYADGRVTAPARFTVLTPGAVDIQIVSGIETPEASTALVADAPAPAEAEKGLGCGTLAYGGLCHTSLNGTVFNRVPPSNLGIRPLISGSSRISDYTVGLGNVYGFAFRYNNASQSFPLQVLTPDNIGDSQFTYVVDYTNEGSAGQALFGPFEATFDDDGNPGTPAVGAVQLGFSLGSGTPVRGDAPQAPANKGGGFYEYIIMDGSTVVARGNASETTPIYAVDPSGLNRVYLENGIMMTRLVDGFEVPGGFKPGDVSAVLSLSNRDVAPVTFHIGEGGGTTYTGRTIHITPAVSQPDLSQFIFTDVRVYGAQTKRYRLRDVRVAAGGSGFFGGPPPSAKGGIPSGGAPWARNAGDYADRQASFFVDAQGPSVFVDYSGRGTAPASYGVLFGPEPSVLTEVPSQFMAVYHTLPFPIRGTSSPDKGGPSGYLIDAPGEFHQWNARVRNRTDNRAETIRARWSISASGKLTLRVESRNGAFSRYEFVYLRDGNVQQVNNYDVATDVTFGVNQLNVFAMGSGQDFGFSSTTGESYGVGYILDTPLSGYEEVYIYPHFDTVGAEVETRSVAAQTNDAHFIEFVENYSFGGGPTRLDGNASHWYVAPSGK